MMDQDRIIAELQRQMQQLLDEREITRLLLSLSRLVDQKDFEGLAQIYAHNGELVLPWGGHRGREGFADYVRKDIGHFRELHHVGAGIEVSVEAGANVATARMNLLATHVEPGEEENFTTVGGYYNLDLIREDGHWRILRNQAQGQWRFSHKTGKAGRELSPSG